MENYSSKMFHKSICVILMTVGAFAQTYTPGTDTYLLGISPLFNPFSSLVLDGPAYISNAPTKQNQNILPNLEQLRYYIYYAASTYYGYSHHDLSCEYCLKFKYDITEHKGKEFIYPKITKLYKSNKDFVTILDFDKIVQMLFSSQ